MQRLDLGHMHDRARHPRLHGVVEEDAVQHMPRGGVQAEGNVGQAEDDLDVREPVPNHPDAFQRPQAELAVVLIARRDGEGQRVDHQVGLRQAVLVAGEFDQPRRDPQLVLRRLGHPHFVDGQRDHRRAELLGELHAFLRRMLAFLEVDRVDDRLAAMQLQRRLDHRRFRRVDHQRRVHAGRKAANDLAHLRHLVAANEGGADIEAVRAFGHLFARDREAPVPVMRRLAFAPSLGPVGVAAFADGEVAVLLP